MFKMVKTLKDTVNGMLSDDWKERLAAEIEQTDIRLAGLNSYLATLDKDDPDYSLLQAQQVHMTDYVCNLMSRANCHGVKYDLPSMGKSSDEIAQDFVSAPPLFGNKDLFDSWLWILILFYLAGGDKK